MTQLDCNVKTCMHNSDNCCCKQKIEVEDISAKEACQTRCGSYDMKGEGSCCNAMGKEPSKATEIDCKAMNCMYNSNGFCDAQHIGITGVNATSSEQTECGSFKIK